MTENRIGDIIVQTTIEIHKNPGSDLLESVYEGGLAHKLKKQGVKVDRQVPIKIEYEGIQFKEAFRADIVVENKVLIELKSVECVTKAHKKQVLTNLKLGG